MPSELLQNMTWGDVLYILSVIVIVYVTIRAVRWFVPWLSERVPKRFRLTLLPFVPVLQLVLVILALVTIVPRIIQPTQENLIAVFGASAIAIGFAFQDYISSLIAGIVAIYERPYRLGDWIEIDGVYGEVKDIGFRALMLVTPNDTLVTIPHKRLWNSSIFNNNTGQREHLCVASFYLHPDHDTLRVQRMLYDVALTSPYLQLSKPIAVVVAEVPWGTQLKLKAYPIDGRDQFRFVTDLTTRGKVALQSIGVRWMNALPSSPDSKLRSQ